ADGSQLLSTGTRVPAANPQNLGVQPHLRISREAVKQQVAQRYAKWDAAMEVSTRWKTLKASQQAAEAAAASGIAMAPPQRPTVGLKVGLTLLIDFDDEPATISQTEVVNFCNGANYTGFGNQGSVYKYYADTSNGKLTYTNVVTVYVRAPKPKSFYNDITADCGTQARMLIEDVLGVLKAMPNYDTQILPQLNNLTVDSQNQAVAFNVFYTGDNGGVWMYGLWPHSWALATPIELSPGGKKLYRYQVSNMGDRLELGTFCHENGHMLCGFPDLYDYDYDSRGGAADFCLMSYGSDLNAGRSPANVSAYLKRAAGWATTTDLDINSSIIGTVSARYGTNFNHIYRYAKPGVPTEYFLVECRHAINRDAYLPGSGIAVWHIDELGDRDDQSLVPNTSHRNYEVTLVQADNLWDFEKNRNMGDSKDLYYKGNTAAGYNNQLTDTSAPNAHWWDGSMSGLVLRDFSFAAADMTFIVGTNDPLPSITTQPVSLTLFMGDTASFSVTAKGAPPLSYQWYQGGTPIPGATNNTYTIASVLPLDSGSYYVTVMNPFGTVTSSTATLTVIATVPLPVALNNTNQTWTTDSSTPWYGQTNLSHDGTAAGRSYKIGHGQQTTFSTFVTGPGKLTFWWKVSSQTNADILTFLAASGSQPLTAKISGEVDWQQQTWFLPAGPQTLTWTYAKNGSVSTGADAGYVDQVSFTAGAITPYILDQPLSQGTYPATPVSFSVLAAGSPPLSYQWRLNGTDLPGATSTSLTIANPSTRDAGVYSVRISSPYGSVLSAEAYLGVVPLLSRGDNSFGQLDVASTATNILGIALGAWHSLALRGDGTVMAWGDNYDGQCAVPPTLNGVMGIAAGGYHSLALKLDSTVVGWGANFNGQATPPAGLSNVVALAAGTWHSLALRADGTVVAWGENLDPLGNFVGQSIVPWGLANVVAIGAGDYHSLAVKSDGTVVAWGDDSQAQCQPPQNLTGVVAVAGGGAHSVALKANGTVVTFGNTWSGLSSFPATLTNVVAVAAGNSHTAVLVGNGSLQPKLLQPVRNRTQFSLLLQTFPGKNYVLESKTSLSGTNWAPVTSLRGSGTLQFLRDPAATTPQRFYRVRQW
ncbi:MAG TPA: M6 family metalloprotease domain-containing protein, partial [Candidatus Sulfotelmatobacter sp.]|nr:M6 family metalloprotease domain-containing protein [Candidatus Sulfotelmatobacter sp.]